jgi:GDP-D-mannose dehydratase
VSKFHGKANVKTKLRMGIDIRCRKMASEGAIVYAKDKYARSSRAYDFLIHTLYSHKYSFKLCSCILFNYVSKVPCGTHRRATANGYRNM